LNLRPLGPSAQFSAFLPPFALACATARKQALTCKDGDQPALLPYVAACSVSRASAPECASKVRPPSNLVGAAPLVARRDLNRCPLDEIVRDGLARNIADPLGFTPRPAQSVSDPTGPSRDRCRLYVAGFWPRFELHSRTTVSWRDLGKRLVAVADSQSARSSLVTCAFGEGAPRFRRDFTTNHWTAAAAGRRPATGRCC